MSYNKARIQTHQGDYDRAVAELEAGARRRAGASAAQDVPGRRPLQPGHGRRGAVADRGRAAPEPALRRRAAAARLVPVARAASTRRRAPLITDRVREIAPPTTTSRSGWRRFYAMEGLARRGHRVAASAAVKLGNENYPLVRGTAQARLRCATDPPLRGARGATCAGAGSGASPPQVPRPSP